MQSSPATKAAAFVVLLGLAAYLVGVWHGDFPPPLGPIIGAIIGTAVWAVEQVLKLLPNSVRVPLDEFTRFRYWPAQFAAVGGGMVYGVDGDPVSAAVSAVVLYFAAGFHAEKGKVGPKHVRKPLLAKNAR